MSIRSRFFPGKPPKAVCAVRSPRFERGILARRRPRQKISETHSAQGPHRKKISYIFNDARIYVRDRTGFENCYTNIIPMRNGAYHFFVVFGAMHLHNRNTARIHHRVHNAKSACKFGLRHQLNRHMLKFPMAHLRQLSNPPSLWRPVRNSPCVTVKVSSSPLFSPSRS